MAARSPLLTGMDTRALGTTTLRTLAVIRLANGALGLLAPALLVRRTAADPQDVAPFYPFRMFGIRTVVLGADLLLTTGETQRRARSQAVLIHGVDTVSALVGALRGDLPRRAVVPVVGVSALNTALAVVARRYAP